MSLIDDLNKVKMNDATEYLIKKELTKEEEMGLTEMFHSSSWDVFTTKILPRVLKVIALSALTTEKDHRFHQGMFFAYKEFLDSANKYAKVGFDEQIGNQMMENVEDSTGYDRNLLH